MSQTTSVAPAMPTRALSKTLKECTTLGEAFQSGEFADRVRQGLPTHLNANAMLRTYIQALNKTPLLAKVDVRQAIGAFLTLSQLGLAPNNALGEAYLIPFARKKWNPATRVREIQGYDLNVIVGYKGYLSLAFRSGLVGAVHADVVYEGDEFDYLYGTEQFLKHRPTGKQPDGATPGYAYAVAHLTGHAAGEPPFQVLPWSKVLQVRNGSQGYQAALYAKDDAEKKGWKLPPSYTDAPWVKHVIPMAMKTAFLRLSTWIPRSLEITGAAAIDEAGNRGAHVDFGAVLDGGSVVDGTVTIDEPTRDASTGFGLRQDDGDPGAGDPDDPGPGAEPTADQVTANRAAMERLHPNARQEVPTSTSATAADAGPPFDAYLADDVGELRADLGNGGHFKDATAWAEAFCHLAAQPGANHALLEENNAEALESLTGELLAMVTDALKPAKTAPSDATPAPTAPAEIKPMPVPYKDGKPDLVAYVQAVRATMIAIPAAAQVAAWDELNRAVFAKFPPTTRKAIAAAIQGAAARFAEPEPGQKSPETPSPDPMAEQQDAADPDIEFVRSLVISIKASKSLSELEKLSNAAVVAKLRGIGEQRPELFQQVVDAGNEQGAKLGGTAGDGR